jgi:SAM-dependent MidA family methyltransferase
MEDALYGPNGYYSSGRARTGRQGDYFTAPDVGAVFGELLAFYFRDWRMRLGVTNFQLVECGPGEGALAESITTALTNSGCDPINEYNASLGCDPKLKRSTPLDQIPSGFTYLAVERSPFRRKRLETKGFNAVESFESLPGPVTGCIFGNELIDAFPVHRVRMHEGKLEEAYVTTINPTLTLGSPSGRPCPLPPKAGEGVADGTVPSKNTSTGGRDGTDARVRASLKWGPPSTPELARYLERIHITLPEGYETEINLSMRTWLKETSRALNHGLIVLLDYGRPAHEYYHPDRTRGTLRAFYQHQVSDNALARPGEQDLTADVDFTSLALDAREAGLDLLAFMDLSSFLISAAEKLYALQLNNAESGVRSSEEGTFYKENRLPQSAIRTPHFLQNPGALQMLIHPDALGQAFQVMILGKGLKKEEWNFPHNRTKRLGLDKFNRRPGKV